MVGTEQSLKGSLFSWKKLLYLAAAGNLLILVYMLIFLQDTLALVLAVVILLGLALLGIRSGVFGRLLLSLVFVDIAVWTVSGAISNFMSGERLSALLIPSFLGVLSLAGLVAIVGGWLGRDMPDNGARAARLFGQAVLVMLVMLVFAGLLFRQRQAYASRPVDIYLTTEQMKYSQPELVSENGQITLHLSNHDLWWHTFTIDELRIDLKVPMAGERQVSFDAPPGTYRYYCNIPGHETIGMVGTLEVGKAGGNK